MIDAIQGQLQINKILPDILQSGFGGNGIVDAKKATATEVNNKAPIDNRDIKNTENQESISETPKVSYTELSDKLKTIFDSQNILIEFSRDEATQKMILKIIDFETREVIRQLPPEITLKIARFVTSTLNTGSLTNAKV